MIILHVTKPADEPFHYDINEYVVYYAAINRMLSTKSKEAVRILMQATGLKIKKLKERTQYTWNDKTVKTAEFELI